MAREDSEFGLGFGFSTVQDTNSEVSYGKEDRT